MIRGLTRVLVLAAVAVALGMLVTAHAMAQTPQTCDSTHALQQNNATSGQTTDLTVRGPCEVKGSTTPGSPLSYYFRNVNIVGGGSLNFDDAQIAFYAENIIVENEGRLIAGDPDPIGTAGGQLTIHLWGAANDPGASCVSNAQCGIPANVWGSNSYSPNPTSCKLTSQLTPATTLPGNVDDCFYPYQTLDTADGSAAAYFGHKVLAVSYGGTLQLFGKKGATYDSGNNSCNGTASCTGSSWVRLAKDALPGERSLQIAGTVNWKKGDAIVLTSTDYLPDHSEQLTLSADAGPANNGITTIDLARPVVYPHNGQLFDMSSAVSRLGANFPPSADMRAAVGLLTRSIRIVSDGATPGAPFTSAPGNYFGGHTIVRQGFAAYQVQGVEFYQLGQGGSIMHYPVHFHMDRKTPADTYVKDSSVWDSMTRWIVLHATQGVLLARNVGYESIGHGYYLEDGTETGNEMYANLGVFARAAVANSPTDPNPLNPRMVPGILTATDPDCASNPNKCPSGYSAFPFYSDSQNPTVFWIMNGMNDFEYNMAVGASACGACYWFVPGAISGPSQQEKWFGYASEQQGLGRAGTTPLEKFVGNTCSTAMEGFVEVGPINSCDGVNQIDPVKKNLAVKNATLYMLPSPNAPAISDTNYWPIVSGLRVPTRCPDADSGKTDADCSNVTKCSAGDESNCDVVVLDKFTTSFNWPESNFAAVWLRQLWTLFDNGVVSDPQNAGINLVTSGGYDTASVFPGYWGLVRQSALIGSSQWENTETYTDGLASNPYTSNAGPFNPFTATIGTGANSNISGLKCAPDPNSGNANNAYCMSQADQVSFKIGGFGGFQRLFSVYDGPIYQDTNAYLDIHPTFFTKNGKVDSPAIDTGGVCKPSEHNGNPCQNAGFISGGVAGLRAYRVPGKPDEDRCYEPNAGIGWKQPNGFYYAPAFHSRNLFFSGVDIRHFVTEPKFTKDLFSFKTDLREVKKAYCTWNDAYFQGFTDIDRETVLNDDDGTLTGLTSPINSFGATPSATPTPAGFTTISVNKESFFDAPTEAWECASDYPANKQKDAKCLPATAKTSPYGYVTTVIYPECAKGAPPPPLDGSPSFCPGTTPANAWGSVCTSSPPNFGCLGVPLYRQLLTKGESEDPIDQLKRMMGQNNFQRSALTVNHGWYYLDTTISKEAQLKHNFVSPTTFIGGGVYDLFFVYSKPTTSQTYQIYIGEGLDESVAKTNVKFGYEGLTLPFGFTQANSSDASSGAWSSSYNSNKGILTLKTDMSKIAAIYSLNTQIPGTDPAKTLGEEYCQPSTMCEFKNNRCQCKANGPYSSLCTQTNGVNGPTVCDWSVKDLDCPAPGCPAFQITFPPACTEHQKDKCFIANDSHHRPHPGFFDAAEISKFFDVNFNLSSQTIAGSQCYYTEQPHTKKSCKAVELGHGRR